MGKIHTTRKKALMFFLVSVVGYGSLFLKKMESKSDVLVSRNKNRSIYNLRPNQHELQHLTQLLGIYIGPKIFEIVMEMLNLGVEPKVIYGIMKNIRKENNAFFKNNYNGKAEKPRHSVG